MEATKKKRKDPRVKGLWRVTDRRPSSELARYYNPLPGDEQFVMFAIRTDQRIVQELYKCSDRRYNGKVNILTDKIINDYIDIHDGDLLLTDYRGVSNCYRYNLQMKRATLDRLIDMAARYEEPKGVIAKMALYLWLLQNVQRDENIQ